jgi:hypothetical protein
MARQSKESRLADVHDRALRAFDLSYMPQQDVRLQCLEDRRFVYVDGAQWEGNLSSQFENRPRFEINKILDSLMRIFNEYRNNRVTVDYRAKDDSGDDETADTMDGLYRADEQESNAEEAYDNAFDEATAGGFGAWRLRAKYEDEDDEDDDRQRICIEPIFDADTSVFFDADAKRQDKSDATKAWVLYSMSHADFEEEYGVDPSSFDKVENLTRFDWFTPDVVYVAEYYEIDKKNRKLHFFRLPATGDEIKVSAEDLDDQKRQDLTDQGYIESRQKTITKRVVHKYIMDGRAILEDCGIIAGEYIPIVPMYGKRMFIDNKERMFGHTRPMKDAQRIYNMEISSLAEQASLFGEQIPILLPEQVAGFESSWATKNISKPAYLLVNPITDANGQMVPAGPIGYTQPPTIPPALQGLIQLAGSDLLELGGNQQQGDQIVSNISAKAVELVQTRLDMKTFMYMDNMKKAMRQSGVIWRSMAKALYDEEGRQMRTIGKDGTESQATLMQPAVGKDGAPYIKNDLSSGNYDVVVDVGPAFNSKRDATVRGLIGVLQFVEDPTMKAAILGMALQNMDGEGMTDLHAFVRKGLVASGVIKPTDEEAKELAQAQQAQQPDGQNAFLLASAQEVMSRVPLHQTEAIKNLAQAQQAQATGAKYEADAAKTLADIQGQMAQMLSVVNALAQQQPSSPQTPQQPDQQQQDAQQQPQAQSNGAGVSV